MFRMIEKIAGGQVYIIAQTTEGSWKTRWKSCARRPRQERIA